MAGRNVSKTNLFDVCSMQFALHYMFQNEERLDIFSLWCPQLKRGGYFIATTMDSDVVLETLFERQLAKVNHEQQKNANGIAQREAVPAAAEDDGGFSAFGAGDDDGGFSAFGNEDQDSASSLEQHLQGAIEKTRCR